MTDTNEYSKHSTQKKMNDELRGAITYLINQVESEKNLHTIYAFVKGFASNK